MENYAKRMALEQHVNGKVSKKCFPVKKLKTDFEVIRKCYELLLESVSLDVPISPSGEWILDNFYVIEEQVSIIQKELKWEEYKKLPSVNGKARIETIAEAIIKLTDGNVTRETIEKFIQAYQTKRKINMNEIWTLPVLLKICLIQEIEIVSKRIIASQLQKFKVSSLVERIIKNKRVDQQVFYSYRNINLNGEVTAYVEYLMFLLKREGKIAKKYINVLNEEIKKAGTTVDEIIKVEHYDMALQRVSISNCFNSLKNVLRYNWSEIFERINGVEEILLKDIWYKKSDYDTKTLYRDAIQKISKKSKLSETYVASEVVKLATEEEKHIGEYLFGAEKEVFLNELGMKHKNIESQNIKLFLYLALIYIPTIIISLKTMNKWFWIGMIPFSEVFLLIVNKMVAKLKVPKIIPRLDVIPEDVNTFVIVPTLVKNKEKVKEIMHQLEIFSLSNNIKNLYFALLADASEENSEKMEFDEAIIKTGKEEVYRLNEKYNEEKFFFLYRKRLYNTSQNKWLGYERKRGMITEFVNYLTDNEEGSFCVNTIKNIPKIKYIITLDCDTILPIDTAKKLIGTMEHPCNKPVIKGKIVTKGYALIQPKVGITIESATKSSFSKIYAGDGGIDAYSTAESNVYQDIFGEAIFTGKGIFNVQIFHDILKNEIPENTVLSHDLLEGSYLRCGLASDIEVIDGFPAKVNSYFMRLHRWTRGDWQIISWMWKKSLNKLSKYKIFDNLRRSLIDIFLLVLLFTKFYWISFLCIFIPFIMDFVESFFNHRIGVKAKNYLPIISGCYGSFLRCLFHLIVLPYKAYLMINAICKTIYRMFISKKNLLEWLTASDAEKSLDNKLICYYKSMIASPIAGMVLLFLLNNNLLNIVAILWIISPYICFCVSKPCIPQKEQISNVDKNEIKEIAERTWLYFKDTMNKENNYLPPDNYQIGRKNKWINRTSATNIGLGLMAIVSAYDLGFINKDEAITKIKQSLDVINDLEKWNGHLYNWYQIDTLKPLKPAFVSTVDSGNFVGYLYVILDFLKSNQEIEYANMVSKLINETDFSKLYDSSKNLFSVGFDIRENKLIDSYYDLLASEARLGSFIAIAKRDVPYKHWFSMSRTLTNVNRLKGLVSWSGTMFEYFMPIIVMPNYPYTLLDETYAFCIESQKLYAKKLKIPWGISESAFYLQDLHYNYQYKAFGIPWLGLKRGLKEEVVVAPYSSILAISLKTRDVLKNVKLLKKLGAFDQYGFYDAIDFTPSRVSIKGYSIVKTYMAHHQALILLSINNYLNNQILQKRWMDNEEIQSAKLLLEERIPKNIVFTKKKKEKVKVLKYKNYEEHVENLITNPSGNVNIQSNNNYTLLIDDYGQGYSMFDNMLLTKNNDTTKIGNCVFIKNVETGKVISNTPYPIEKDNQFEIKFSPSESKFYRKDDEMEIVTQIAISPEDDIELREITITNLTENVLDLEIISYLEPVMSSKSKDVAHPAFNNLFFRPSIYEKGIILEKRMHGEKYFYINFLVSDSNGIEFELDKVRVIGRLNSLEDANVLYENVKYTNKCMPSTNTVISFKIRLKIEKGERRKIFCYYATSKNEEVLKDLYQKYQTEDNAKRLFELAYSKSIVENRFLGYKGRDIILYNKLFSELIKNNTREKYEDIVMCNVLTQKDLWKFGISGDLPIILVRINRVNDIYFVKDLLSAIEYYHQKKLLVDLVILNEEENRYEQYVQDKLYETISSKGLGHLLHQNGGIFIIKKADVTKEEESLIYSCSDMILNAKDGFLFEQLNDLKTDERS